MGGKQFVGTRPLARRPFSGSIRRLQAHSVYHKQRILPAPSENTTQFIASGCETESRKCLIGCTTFFFSVCLENSWSPSLNFLKIVEPVCQGWQRGCCGFIYLFVLLLHNTSTFHADEPSAGSIRGEWKGAPSITVSHPWFLSKEEVVGVRRLRRVGNRGGVLLLSLLLRLSSSVE